MKIGKEIGSALIGGASNLLGNLLGNKSQSDANKTNLKIAQMNNEFNERMMQKQMDYNTEMWEKENAYNTASAQRKRLEDAGLNPSLMMNGGSPGTASSVGGINPPSAQATQVQAFHPDFSGIAQAAQFASQQMMQKEMQKAQIENMYANTDVARAKALSEIGKAYQETKNIQIRNTFEHRIKAMELQQMGADYWHTKSQTRHINEQARNIAAQTLLLDKEYTIFDDKWNVEKANIAANTLQYAANAHLSKQQARHEVYKSLLTQYQAQGQKDANRTAQRVTDAIVDKAYKDNEYLDTLIGLAPFEKGGSVLNSIFGTALTGITAYGLLRGFKGVPPIKGFR